MNTSLEKNKQNAIAFYQMAYEGDPLKATELFVGEEYIQHNPLVGNGKEPFIAYFEKMHRDYLENDNGYGFAINENSHYSVEMNLGSENVL